MADKKMTKVEYYGVLRAFVEGSGTIEDTDDMLAFIDTQVAQIEAKAVKAKERAASRRAEGDELRDAVQAVLTSEYQTLDDIVPQIEGEDISRAKISARMTQLVRLGVAEKEPVKGADGRKAMAYRLIAAE